MRYQRWEGIDIERERFCIDLIVIWSIFPDRARRRRGKDRV